MYFLVQKEKNMEFTTASQNKNDKMFTTAHYKKCGKILFFFNSGIAEKTTYIFLFSSAARGHGWRTAAVSPQSDGLKSKK
jgi:hypothetical protein